MRTERLFMGLAWLLLLVACVAFALVLVNSGTQPDMSHMNHDPGMDMENMP